MSRRLLFVTPSAYVLGGVPVWLDYLVPGLAGLGWDVTVGLTAGRYHDVGAYLDQHPFPKVISISCGSGTQEGRIIGLASAIRSVAPNIIAFTNVPDACLAAARLRRRSSRVSSTEERHVVLVNHGLQHDLFSDMRLLRSGLDAVVNTNRLASALAASFSGIEKDRSYYCPCGTTVPAARPALKTRGGRPLRIGYFGRFEQDQKRVLDLPRIAAELQRMGIAFELVLAGAGPDEDILRSSLAQATTSPITFLGAVSPSQIQSRVLDVIDAMILTSGWETGPLVVWEAMAAGIPVVTSAYVGSGLEGSLVHGDNCLMYSIGDCRAAADAITKLSDVVRTEAMAERAFQLVRQRYSIEASVRGWHTVLSAILELPVINADGTKFCFKSRPAGRLDRWVGSFAAELLRVALGRRFTHSGPGGEWPHTLSSVDARSPQFWEVAATLDRSSGAR